MIYNQPAVVQNVNHNQELKEVANQGEVKNVKVNVVNQAGELQNSYTISGQGSEVVGSKLKNESNVIQVLNKGIATTIESLQKETFNELGNVVTVMEQANMSINASYTVNGKVYPLMQNPNNEVTLNGARIYVPSSILKDTNNQLTSVEIDGGNYSAKVEGNYIVVNAPIEAISGESHNVVVNFSNDTVKLNENTASSTTTDVDVVVMNQFGQEILSQNVQNASGTALAKYLMDTKGQILNMAYNGQTITLMDLLTQTYVPGTANTFVITEFTQAPITATATINGHGCLTLPNRNDAVNVDGAKFEIPSGLARNFNASSVMINGIEYKGHMEGNSYVVNEFIPNAVEYSVQLNLVRK